uniref:Uncharacterized protein n=1 Tax=Plectus sambesii TaxID=2011161 RepID=A0A914V4W3_9BILA
MNSVLISLFLLTTTIFVVDAQAAWFLRPSWAPAKGKRNFNLFRPISRHGARPPGITFRGKKSSWHSENALDESDLNISPNWR